MQGAIQKEAAGQMASQHGSPIPWARAQSPTTPLPCHLHVACLLAKSHGRCFDVLSVGELGLLEVFRDYREASGRIDIFSAKRLLRSLKHELLLPSFL